MLTAVLASLLALAVAVEPRAPSPDEEKLFADGMAAYARGDTGAAETAWRAGYQLARDPAFLVRIGEAQEKAGTPAAAAETYRRYLREAPDAADRDDIEARIARLAPPAGAAAVGATGGTGRPSPPEDPPGDLRVEGGGGRPAESTAPAAAPPAMPAAGSAALDPARASGGPGSLDQPEAGTSVLGVVARVSMGVAGALLGSAAFYAISASDRKDEVNRLVTFVDPSGRPLEYETVARRYEQAVDDGRRFDRYAKTLLLASAGTVALGVVLFVVDAAWDRRRRAELALTAAPTGPAAAAAWTF